MQQHSIEAIRQAIGCGEYERARRLWQECVAGLTEELDGGGLTAAGLEEIGALVDWSRGVVQCERAQLLNQLNRFHVASEYGGLPPRSAPRIVEASF